MLRFEVQRDAPGTIVLALHGDLAHDDWTERLRGSLATYLDDGIARVDVDLEDVQLIDLAGVATLIVLWREANLDGKRLRVRGARAQPEQKLTQAGVLDLLTSA